MILHHKITLPDGRRIRVRRVFLRMTTKTTLYWWPERRHRHYDPITGRPTFFSFRRGVDFGGGYRCSWLQVWIFELRTVHRPESAP